MQTIPNSRRLRTPILILSCIVGLVALAGQAAAAPTLKSTTSASTGSPQQSLTILRPAGVAPGDVLVAVVTARQYGYMALSGPAGWTRLRADASSSGAEITQSLYVRVATSAEPSSYTWTFSSRISAAGVVAGYSGVDPASPVVASSGAVSTNSRAPTAPSIASVAGMLVVGFFGSNGATSVAPPPDMFELRELQTSGSTKNATLEVASTASPQAGSTGSKTASLGSTSNVVVGQLLGLRPGGATTSPTSPTPTSPTSPTPTWPTSPTPSSPPSSNVTAPKNTALPTISGTPQVGKTLSAAPGTWNGTQPLTFSYRWERWSPSRRSWKTIVGAAGSSLILTSSELDASVRVVVTASNTAGSSTAASTGTSRVTAAPAPSTAPSPTPSPTSGAVPQRLETVEDGALDDFDQVSGTVEPSSERAYEGQYSAHASTPANQTNSTQFARGIFESNWGAGADVWYGMAIYLPNGFYAAQQSQIDVMRWDNWSIDPNTTDRSGVVIYGSDHKARLVRQRLGVEQVTLLGPFTISEGTWHWLEVHQKLSETDGQALSEVYLDGQRVGASTQKNWYGRNVTRLRYGIVARGDGAQSNALDLWFDRATIATSQVGPV